MPKKAFSYIRFSSENQSQGDSLRRQLEATTAYCEKNDLVLDDSLNLRDLGVSAFKGKNATTGSLARFIDLAERGDIPKGSALVVESLDRISRQSPRRTVALLSQLLDLGIELHLTMANKVFKPSKSEDSGSQEGIDLILAVAWAMRSHEESETKSRRLREVFERKRQRAAAGEVLFSKTVPWWLTIEDGKIVAVPERAKILRLIYQLKSQGWSTQRIARHLNSEGIPTWRPNAKEWQDSRIRDAIRFDAPQGHLTPTSKAKTAGRSYRIENYYPRVISEELAREARASIKQKLYYEPESAPKSGRLSNLFKGILRHNGRWCRFQPHQNGLPDDNGIRGWNGYYDDHDPNNDGKKTWSMAANQLEPLVVHGLRELTPEDLLPQQPKAPNLTAKVQSQVFDLERKIDNIVEAIAGGKGRALTLKLAELETALAEKKKELLRVQAKEKPSTNSRSLLRSISVDLKNLESRARTAHAIRRLVSRIDVGEDWTKVITERKLQEYFGFALKDFTAGNEAQHVSMVDPVPANKRRKAMTVLITFRSGASRILHRDVGFKDVVLNIPLAGTAGVVWLPDPVTVAKTQKKKATKL